MDSACFRRLAKLAGGGYGRAHMKSLDELFQNNREWAEKIRRQDPEFFAKLSRSYPFGSTTALMNAP